MRDGEPYVFRLFPDRVPSFLATWRKGPSFSEWHRHYVVGPGYSLSLVKGERVDLTRYRVVDGFRVEQNLLSAAFPLDWMALTCIGTALPREFRDVEIDGRTPQGFVDSLAMTAIPQASVLKETETAFCGTMIARATYLTVPDAEAHGLMVAVEGSHPNALRTVLSAAGFGGLRHQDLDDWLRRTLAAAGAGADADAEPGAGERVA
jgi:hypothetical protein